MAEALRDVIRRGRAGEAVAMASVCSAHPDVLRAALRWARRQGRAVVIEATSNQVNQYGGYTGQRPADFAALVWRLAAEEGVDRAQVVLGGDHLGPQVWRGAPAAEAMTKAREMMVGYVEAGFEKLHLDCSFGCAGEPEQVTDAIAAERSAELAVACERAAGARQIDYVIGTEVPPPGGARQGESAEIAATTPAAAAATLAAHEAGFAAAGLAGFAERVVGLVVQPGVEFSPMAVHHLPMARDPGLRAVAMGWPCLTLEAHSTDYQRAEAYPRLAALGFGILKVGPALTHAYRHALYALDGALALAGRGTGLAEAMERVMRAQPGHWQGHYAADDRAARHVGLADRIRYYWPTAEAQAAVRALAGEADAAPVPEALLREVFSDDVLTRAEALRGGLAERLAGACIEIALDPYAVGAAA